MPDQRFILYTRPDGRVSVCAPSLTAMRYMTNGGGRWDDILPIDRDFLDRQIAEQSKHGVGESAAYRFVHAMQYGGFTHAEAYEIMRDRFCAHLGTACELIDILPYDRWFRNAWRRSHNGGPIYIDMPKARKIQIARMKNAASAAKAELQWGRWRQVVRTAGTPAHLREVWPKGLTLG